jgi:hypothetical protein
MKKLDFIFVKNENNFKLYILSTLYKKFNI